MRTLGITALCVVLLIGGSVVWYKVSFPTYTHRYRLVLAITVGGQPRSGNSVIEVSWIGQPELGSAPPFFSSVKGQAVLVDLPGGGGLLAALHTTPDLPQSINADVLAIRAFQLRSGLDSYRQIMGKTGRRDLSRDNMPLMIWFSNIADPTTARPITAGHIPELLGGSAQISSAYIEMTSDSVVVDIQRKLPWVKSLIAEKNSLNITRPGQFKLVDNMFVGDDP